MLRVTKTENGAVKGFPGTDARITVFKGIPYAAPPVGENRWRAPQPVENWDGVKECYEYGAICTQKTPGADPNAFYSKEWHVDPEVAMDEHGLYLNIWTPAKTGDEKLPVMLWIHGGGMQEGYGYEMEFDGERFASRGVILVSIGYRLNLFGFLAHPELTAENPDAPTNFALLDQAAAIKWCRRNIANFGGDPDNITIFGQSGGGAAVQFQVCAPSMKGEFKRAIIQSAGTNAMVFPKFDLFLKNGRTLEEAEQLGVKFFEFLGIKTLAEARALDATYLEKKYHEFGMPNTLVPVIENKFVPELPETAMVGNRINDVDIMVTATGDEFMAGVTSPAAEWIAERCEEYADDYMKLVKDAAGSDDPEAIRKAADYSTFNVANRLTAEILARNGREVYFSEFDPYIPGDDAGAFHSCDLWFEFDNIMKCWRPFDGHHYDLARKMCNYFANFARTGNPNGNDADGTPMPEWKPYTADNRLAIRFADEISMEKAIEPRMKFLIDVNLKKVGLL